MTHDDTTYERGDDVGQTLRQSVFESSTSHIYAMLVIAKYVAEAALRRGRIIVVRVRIDALR
jgi:hypothetical protein